MRQAPELVYKTGINQIDNSIVLRAGQVVVLSGETANQIVFRLAAMALSLQGGKENIAFIDGGNSFDPFTITMHLSNLGKKGQERERVHLSRAFTYPQLAQLIREKLPDELTIHSARMVIVSDITMLFSDPDVKERGEVLSAFRSSVRFLAGLAREYNVLVIVTALESRDRRMDSILLKLGNVFVRVEDRGGSTRLTVKKNPSLTRPRSTKFDFYSIRVD